MNYKKYTMICLLGLGLLGKLSSTVYANPQEVRIGLRAHSGIAVAQKQWQPTADYLTKNIPGYHFKIEPYNKLTEIMQAAGENRFDFVFTNPSSYVEMNLRYNVKSLVTLINKRNNTAQARFGSVIFTHVDNTDIDNLKDLKGKTFMAVSEPAFGGWRVGWLEMKQHGIDPYNDFEELTWGGRQPA